MHPAGIGGKMPSMKVKALVWRFNSVWDFFLSGIRKVSLEEIPGFTPGLWNNPAKQYLFTQSWNNPFYLSERKRIFLKTEKTKSLESSKLRNKGHFNSLICHCCSGTEGQPRSSRAGLAWSSHHSGLSSLDTQNPWNSAPRLPFPCNSCSKLQPKEPESTPTISPITKSQFLPSSCCAALAVQREKNKSL